MDKTPDTYLDYQAVKPVDERVFEQMKGYFNLQFGNPSSLHNTGDFATNALAESREKVANFIGAKPNEIIFTGSATESNNLAMIGFALRNKRKGNHIIISEVEHISMHNIVKWLERDAGFMISKVPVDQFGRVKVEKLKKRIRDNTILISVQAANNEIGTIQPIKEIGEIAEEKEIAFHTDAVAAEGQFSLDVNDLKVDMMTLSSNDIYGPRGIGALYLRKGTRLKPIIIGGGQERGLRSGSENMPGIVGMGAAAELQQQLLSEEIERMRGFQKRLIPKILEIPKSHLNGHPTERIPSNSHFRFEGIEGESILLVFKEKNIAIATGSACSSKTLEPSHTLIATGLLHEEAHGSLEITTGRFTNDNDIDRLLETTPGVVERLRSISPLYREE